MSCPGKPYARALTVSLALLVPAAGTGAAEVPPPLADAVEPSAAPIG